MGLFDDLEASEELENTIVVLVSDNGASGEGGPNGSVNENKFFNGIPDSIEENLKYVDELGGPKTYNHYALGWAWAFNTPFKLWKRYGNYRGGTADPLIVSWPAHVEAGGELRRQYNHAVDIVPTLYEWLGVELPEAVDGHVQKPLEGVSFAATVADANAETGKDTQFYSMLGTRAIWHRGWKAATAVPASPAYWAPFEEQRWELFDTDKDPSECHDLAEQHPDKFKELIDVWWAEAERYQALPLETRNAVEAITTPRPQLSKPRDRYIYHAGGSAVPESVAPNIRGRSYTLAVELEVDTPEAGGVLFEQGSRFGGHALYVKDGKLSYVYNMVGELVQTIESDETIPTGHVVVSATFTKDEGTMPAEGTLTLHIRDRQVGEGHIRTQPGKFDLTGPGFLLGRSGGEPVSDDYPGQPPWRFAGGTLKRFLVDLSGEPFEDLAREAAAAYARQ